MSNVVIDVKFGPIEEAMKAAIHDALRPVILGLGAPARITSTEVRQEPDDSSHLLSLWEQVHDLRKKLGEAESRITKLEVAHALKK